MDTKSNIKESSKIKLIQLIHERPSEYRNKSFTGQGGCHQSPPKEGSISIKHLSKREKRTKYISPNNKFKKLELIHTLREIQNGNSEGCKEYNKTRRSMMKLDLKDTYFSVPLNQKLKKCVQFQWEGTLYEFQCLMFGLGPAPKLFTKKHNETQ